MLVGDLLIQDCIQAFLQHTANGRSLKAQCHHIMSINCQVLECEAALFLQDLIDHLRYFLKDCDPVSADGRLTKRICLVQLDQLPGSILTVLAQKPFNWLSVGRDGHVMIANESYNSFFAGVIEAKSTEDTLRHRSTLIRVPEEVPNAILGERETGRLPNVMQQGCPTKHRFRGDTFNDRDGMVPDILVMMWIMLRKAKHGCELRDRDGQHIGEVPQNTCRALSAEHFGKLNQNALRSDTFEQVLVPVDGRCRGSFDRHAIGIIRIVRSFGHRQLYDDYNRTIEGAIAVEYIVMDMEWNQALTFSEMVKDPVFLTGEIIQIGAIKLNQTLEVVDSFNERIAPQYYTELHPKVAEITKLSNRNFKEQRYEYYCTAVSS